MKITKMSYQVFIVCICITLSSLIVTTLCASYTYKKFYIKNMTDESIIKAKLIRSLIVSKLNASENDAEIDMLCKAIGSSINRRITVIHPSGLVLGDSEKDPDSMENHALRPEVMSALHEKNGVEKRFSSTLGFNMLYVAIPVMQNKEVAAVLRISEPMEQITNHTHFFYRQMGIASGIALLIIAVVSISIARKLSNPISEMKKSAERIANGELDLKIRVPQGEEVSGLARALNEMAKSLGDRIRIITNQKNELDTILANMTDGVITVDANEKILTINPAAAELLSVSTVDAKGKWIYDLVRNSSLQKLIQDTMANYSVIETDIILNGPDGERFINIKGKNIGASDFAPDKVILVLHDVTSSKRLEIMRKDFVANVSHELRTPLTAIKGFVETICSHDYNLPDDVTRFLGIISSKTDRLCSMVNDLLALSTIERIYEQKEVVTSTVRIRNILINVSQICYSEAVNKKVTLNVDCDETIDIVTNADLLEQAILNLIDNAIKYSRENTTVNISAHKNINELVITVKDQGIGISPEHQQRIFERFYRVDKARSRQVGGTGLGLSIVKNICLTLGATINVESKLGAGSTFRIVLGTNA